MSAIKSLSLVITPKGGGIGQEPNQGACSEEYIDGSVLFAVASGEEATWVAESFVDSMKGIKDRSGKPFATSAPPSEVRSKWLGMVLNQCTPYLNEVAEKDGFSYDLNIVWGVITPHGWGMAEGIGNAPHLHNAEWDAEQTCALTGNVFISAGTDCPPMDKVLKLLEKKGEEETAIQLDSLSKAQDYCAFFAAISPTTISPSGVSATTPMTTTPNVVVKPTPIQKEKKPMSDLELALAELKAAEAEVTETRTALALAIAEHESAIAHLAICQDRFNKLNTQTVATATVEEPITSSALVWVGSGEGHCRTLGNHCENIGILPAFEYQATETSAIKAYDFSADFEAIAEGFNKLAEALSSFEVVIPEVKTLDKDDEKEEAYYELLAAEEVVEQTAQAVTIAEAAVKSAETRYEAALALIKQLEAAPAPAVVAPIPAPSPNTSALTPTSKVPAVRGVQVRAIKLYEANGASVNADKAIAEVLTATNSAVAMTAMKQLEAAYGISSSDDKQVLSSRDED